MKVTIGALAHVDAGKTTLSESILFVTNSIRIKGRVDHKDSFLDFNLLEKEKGITIYNKQANFSYNNQDYIYIDTPGHSDLAYEANRAISILDAAILIVSAIEDIPTDTIKQFNNLLNYNIPILIFVNKMDITSFTKEDILKNIQNKLSINITNIDNLYEHISLLSEELLEEYIKTNTISDKIIISELKNNNVIPCIFGSALKDEGTLELLEFINKYVKPTYDSNDSLNAYIYKQSQDYSYLKIISGSIENKISFNEYKVNEMYEVSGDKYIPINKAYASNIIAVKGLKDISIGTYLPSFTSDLLYKVPSLQYRILSDMNVNELYKKLESIIVEYPELNITLDNRNIYINLNGELQQTIIKNMLLERLNINVEFSNPIINYKETILQETYGVGHFEPLRHYGEVLVKIKPYDSGIKISSMINNQYSNTLVSYLRNYICRGILTNSPLTNIEICIIDIKTHPKHTEGGDLVQSLRRAIRHALTKTKSTLLEPFYLTSIDINDNNINTIISFLTSNNYLYTLLENKIAVKIPLMSFNDTLTNLKSRLKGNIGYTIEEIIYDDCLNQEEIISKYHYDYRNDMRNPAGSIFCKSGAGHYVEPEDVEANMHLDMSLYIPKDTHQSIVHNKSKINEEELKRIWNNLYKPKPRYIEKEISKTNDYLIKPTKPLLYLIDGYNLMYYLDEELAINDLINAREKTINLVCDFAGYVSAMVVLVFDAYKANGVKEEIIQEDNITVVYTRQNQTADTYIENKSKELKNDYKVTVVTSDNLEQLKVFSNNASIISSRELLMRYDNFKKNSKHLNNKFSNKPLEELKKILIDEE